MDYYIVNEDDRIKEPVSLDEYTKEQAGHFKDFVITATFKKTTKLPAYIKKKLLFDPRHLVSDKLLDVMEMYEPEIRQRGVFITNMEELKQYVYWEVDLDVCDCVASNDKDSITLKQEAIEDLPFFKINVGKQSLIVFRFDVCESVLRRYLVGIQFTKAGLV